MNSIENVNKLIEKAEHEVREKRILNGMDIFNLKKQDYVVFSLKDYNELVNTLKNNKIM